MKVNNSVSSSSERVKDSGGSAKAGAVGKSSESKASKNSKSEISENISISPRAKEAAFAKEVASQASDVNEEKVARLKEAINKGAYKVDADKIADRLFDDHLFNSI